MLKSSWKLAQPIHFAGLKPSYSVNARLKVGEKLFFENEVAKEKKELVVL